MAESPCLEDSDLLPLIDGGTGTEAILDHLAACSRCGDRLKQLRSTAAGRGDSGPAAASTEAIPSIPATAKLAAADSDIPETVATPPITSVITRRSAGPAAADESGRSPAWPLPDRYALRGRLGRGGMGEVLLAHDEAMGRDVAIKLLRPNCDDPADRRRFLEEARITGQLQHPGIPAVYDRGTLADGRPYFAMKRIQGSDLARILAGRGAPGGTPALDRPQHLAVFEQICRTIAYAHSRRVIHRDLKPANVMVGAFGEVQVMDWGLAKLLDDPAGARGDFDPIRPLPEGVDRDASQGAAGTPAYMPVEQALGEADRVDERADVFGLGAILCEILTGRPPYTGSESTSVYSRVISGDIGPAFARLDACEADAELVALAKDCLVRERDDRPRHAGIVADRVTAYLAGVQRRLADAEIARADALARAEEEEKRSAIAYRLAGEANRRRRITLALAAALLALIVVGGGAAAGFALQRQARQARVAVTLAEADSAIAEAERADDGPAWERARVALAQAEESAGDSPDPAAATTLRELAGRIDAAQKFRELIASLESIRGEVGDRYSPNRSTAVLRKADSAFAAAFRRFGIDVDAPDLDPKAAGATLAGRPASPAVAAALDTWVYARRDLIQDDEDSWKRLVALARVADPDPWRDRLRDFSGRPAAEVRDGLAALISDQDAFEKQPAASIFLLSEALRDAGDTGQALDVLRRGWLIRPSDFWINFWLGTTAVSNADRDHTERFVEAARYLTAAISARPSSASAYNNLGLALRGLGRLDDAIAAYRQGIRVDAANGDLHSNLGIALQEAGKLDEAIVAHAEAVRLDPEEAENRYNQGIALGLKGRRDEAIVAYKEAVRLEPGRAEFHNNLGVVLRHAGRREEAVDAFREAVRLRPDYPLAYYNLGNTLRDLGRLDEAGMAYVEAIRLKDDYAEAYCNVGLVLRSQGKYALSLESLRRGHELGSKRSDWRSPSARWLEEAEQLAALAERLAAVVRGEDVPMENSERLMLAQMAYESAHYATASALWGRALEVDPGIAGDRVNQHAYNAACMAILASTGRGDDAPAEPATRLALRRRALGWLNAELREWNRVLDSAEPKAKASVAETMAHWKADGDLAAVRDAEGLAALPAKERAEWESVWAQVDRLLERAGR